MRENTAVLLEEMRGKMSAYAFQFGYYLSNLPVKAEAAALLPISVEVDGQAVHLEEVAGAGILDDTHFFFYPVEKKWMPNIEEAILKVHPDYKITHEKIEEAPEDNDEQIVAEVPPVDKDRHQQMKDAVGTFADTCKAQMESNSQLYNSRIAVSLMGASDDEVKEAKDAAQQICDWHDDLVKQYRENKEQEIDAAYAAWLEGNAQKESKQSEQEQAEGEDAMFNMKMS